MLFLVIPLFSAHSSSASTTPTTAFEQTSLFVKLLEQSGLPSINRHCCFYWWCPDVRPAFISSPLLEHLLLISCRNPKDGSLDPADAPALIQWLNLGAGPRLDEGTQLTIPLLIFWDIDLTLTCHWHSTSCSIRSKMLNLLNSKPFSVFSLLRLATRSSICPMRPHAQTWGTWAFEASPGQSIWSLFIACGWAVGAFSSCPLWFHGLASACHADTDLFLVLICQYLLPPVCLEGKNTTRNQKVLLYDRTCSIMVKQCTSRPQIVQMCWNCDAPKTSCKGVWLCFKMNPWIKCNKTLHFH